MPVLCVTCGHDVMDEVVDGRCSHCGVSVLQTLHRRGIKPDGPVYAPLVIVLCALTLPCSMASPMVGFILSVVALAVFMAAVLEYQANTISPLLFYASAGAALISALWILMFLALVVARLI